MITRHFRNTLAYIQSKKQARSGSRWNEVDVIGASLKMGIGAK